MLFALIGEESLLIKRALDKLLQERLDPASRDFNFDRFDGKTLEARRVIEVVMTLPVMAKSRMVLIHEVQDLKKGVLEELEPVLPKIPQTTDLVFVGNKVDRRLSFWKGLEKIAKVLDVSAPVARDLPSWVQREAREKGYELSFEAAQWMVAAVGTDLTLLISSLEKICLLKGTDKKIALQDVESCITASSWKSIFDLADAVGRRDLGHALRLFKRMYLSGESPIALLAILARHFRILLKVKAGDSSGIPPFFLKDYQRQSHQFEAEALHERMETLFAADWALKSSGQKDQLVFERLLMELCA